MPPIITTYINNLLILFCYYWTMKIRRWTDQDLVKAVRASRSVRQVIHKLSLIPAGGNYTHVNRRIKEMSLDTSHFTGKGWNTSWRFDPRTPRKPLGEILTRSSTVQSHKLKNRLFEVGLKKPQCELCHWSEQSIDGRIPVELDHINGDHSDNRISNLRILCPNCHSLQLTHRGMNKKNRYARVS